MDTNKSKRNIRNAGMFVREIVWEKELASMSALRRFCVKIMRVIHLVFKGFRDDECPLHASALTFNTLLAIVPVLALSLALARVFGGAELAQQRVLGLVSDFTARFEMMIPANVQSSGESQTVSAAGDGTFDSKQLAEELKRIVNAGFHRVEKINFTELGAVGLILLVLMVISVLGRVELSFNRVWGVVRGRSLMRKFTDYLFMVIVLPFLITMASALPIVELVGRFNASTAAGVKSVLGSAMLSDATPVLITILTLTVIVKFMPNTKVKILPAFTGGIVSGLLFIGWLWACAAIQVGVAGYSKLYGSFAVVPIVLAWVYVSWEIILFGAEVAFAVQNCATYRMEQGAQKANVQSKIMLALSVIVEAGRSMTGTAHGFEVSSYASRQKIPVKLINDMVSELEEAGFLAKLSQGEGRFALLRSPGNLTVKEVIDVVVHSGIKPEDLGLDKIDSRIKDIVRKAIKGADDSLHKLSIEDLIAPAAGRKA